MNLSFTDTALRDLEEWVAFEPRTARKLFGLFREVCRTPFEGTGKPEMLKHAYSGCWSRRITQEHRLVYQVLDQQILIISCRGHYE